MSQLLQALSPSPTPSESPSPLPPPPFKSSSRCPDSETTPWPLMALSTDSSTPTWSSPSSHTPTTPPPTAASPPALITLESASASTTTLLCASPAPPECSSTQSPEAASATPATTQSARPSPMKPSASPASLPSAPAASRPPDRPVSHVSPELPSTLPPTSASVKLDLSKMELSVMPALSSAEPVPPPLSAQLAQMPPPGLLPTIATATPDSTTQEPPSARPAPPSASPAHLPLFASPAMPALTEPSSMVSVSAQLVSSRWSTPTEA